MRPPLLAGERKPRTAKMRTASAMLRTWAPEPTRTERKRGMAGARNTSPCTSFHPVSSCASSTDSSL